MSLDYSERTVGVVAYREGLASIGYTLFSAHRTTYLIDLEGYVVKHWESRRSVFTAYLTESGNLLRDGGDNESRELFQTGGAAGYLEVVNWENELVWWWRAEPCWEFLTHHDVQPISDGRVLVLCWQKVSAEKCKALGRRQIPDDEVWDNHVVELAPPFDSFEEHYQQENVRGLETWRWRQFDHLVQDADPSSAKTYGEIRSRWRDLDFNYTPAGGKARRRNSLPPKTPPHPTGFARFDPDWKLGHTGERDWLHVNSVSYDEDRALVLLSYNVTSEIFIISRRTDQLLFRFGNPAVYRAGDPKTDRILYSQHSAVFVQSNSATTLRFLCFNNGCIPHRPWSSVDEFQINSLSAQIHTATPDSTSIDSTTHKTGLTASSRISDKINSLTTTINSDTKKETTNHHQLLLPEAPTESTCQLVWSHGPKAGHHGSFYSTHSSGVDRCPNDNTLITLGPQGIIFEVTRDHQEAWRYISPVEVRGDDEAPAIVPQGHQRGASGKFGLFCARRYAPDFPAFRGRVLLPGRRIEDAFLLAPILPRSSSAVVPAASAVPSTTTAVVSDHSATRSSSPSATTAAAEPCILTSAVPVHDDEDDDDAMLFS